MTIPSFYMKIDCFWHMPYAVYSLFYFFIEKGIDHFKTVLFRIENLFCTSDEQYTADF